MQYIIQVGEVPESSILHTSQVDDFDAEYLNRATVHFNPLTHEQFNHGLALVFHTGARYSYILDGDELLVCI